MFSTHSDRLERWLGPDCVAQLSRANRGTYFDPIPIAIGDGRVQACKDGDFKGPVFAGYEASYEQWMHDQEQAVKRAMRVYTRRGWMKRQNGTLTGRDSIIAAISAGKKQVLNVAKAGVTGVANISNTLWDVGTQPSAGSTSAAPGGSAPTNTTTGGLLYDNATGGDTMHFIQCVIAPTVAAQLLLLYDRYFQVNHNIATDPQAVTGVPTRYQSTAARNTFMSVHVTTALGAGTPTYTITYVDSEGNAAEATAAQTIVASAIARRFPFAASVGNGWFFPLNSGDRGVREIDNLDLSAASTGNLDVILGKPIAWIPQPFANVASKFDATLSPGDLMPIDASACLALLEINKGATTATSYNGAIALCAG